MSLIQIFMFQHINFPVYTEVFQDGEEIAFYHELTLKKHLKGLIISKIGFGEKVKPFLG